MEFICRKSLSCSTKTVLLVVALVLSGFSCGAAKDQKHRHRHHHHHHHHEKDVHLTPSQRTLGLLSVNDSISMGKHATHGTEKHFPQSAAESENESMPRRDDACLNVLCPSGRICSSDPSTGHGAVCRCPDDHHCRRKDRKGRRVCGSDGRFYDNQCKLLRQACLKGEGIRVVRDEGVCWRQRTKNENDGQQSSSSSFNRNASSSWRRNAIHLSAKEDMVIKHQFRNNPLRKSSLEEEEQKHMRLSGRNQKLNKEKVKEDDRMVCTREELEKLMKGLMRRQCIRTRNKDCDNGTEWQQVTAEDLFADLDLNSDLSLELLELNKGDQLASYSVLLLSKVCRLQDLLTFYDMNQDALLSLAEFYSSLDVLEKAQMSKTAVVVGTSVELKCDSLNMTGIIWKRNGRTLGEIYNNDIRVLGDGSLYLHEVTLSHIGNYICVDRISQNVIRSHMVQVQVFPIVRVSPLTQFHTSGSTSTLRCHAEGVPYPRLSWDFNELPVPSQPDHYLLLHHSRTLLIKDSQYLKDTGAFKCKARNTVGTSQDIATVFVENSDVPKYGRAEDPYELFLVFHDDGYSVHEPSHCHIQHIVAGTFAAFKFRPDIANHNSIQSLCELNQTCSWGDAINVQNKFIYVSQPSLNRIIVIEVRDRFNPVEIISTDRMPVQLNYIDHLDEVWVLCWNQGRRDSTSKTSLIIRQASSDIQHHTIYIQSMRNSFSSFSAIYLPPNSALNHHFNYGYAVDSSNTTTYKVDLVAMKLAHAVNLSCNPISVAFVALGGKVVVNCGSQAPGIVVLDYLTDEVLEMLNVTGDPYVSPDSRFLVAVDNAKQRISVYRVSDEGAVEHGFDLNPELMVSDGAFLASDTGYDFFASSSDKNSVLYVDLSTGLVETVEGVGEAPRGEEQPWSPVNRIIVAGGMFSDYLMLPSNEAIVVLDARRRHLQCEWQEMTSHANVIVWTEVSKL